MPFYEYENSGGERVQVWGTMKAPPSEAIRIDQNGDPSEIDESEIKAFGGTTKLVESDAGVWRRVYAAGLNVQVPEYGIKSKGLPVSRSLPPRKGGVLDKLHGVDVKRHSDGGYTNLRGQPIIENKNDVLREKTRSGLDWE